MGFSEKFVDVVNKEMFKGCVCLVLNDYSIKFGILSLDEFGYSGCEVIIGDLWVGGE